MPFRRYLEHNELPPLDSSTGENMEIAFKKRGEIVDWANHEVKKWRFEMNRRQNNVEAASRYGMMKKFLTCIRTSAKKMECEFWVERKDKDPEDFYCEYVARRENLKAQRATR